MTPGKVVGYLWATCQDPLFDGQKLLIVEPMDLQTGKLTGGSILACDAVQAGIGDMVLVVYEGGSARMVLNDEKTSAEAVVVGVIDRYDLVEA